MKVTGSHTFVATVDQVWAAVNDPAVLARTLPGCETLTEVGEDTYAMRVTAGVAAVKGTYEGTVALADKQAPSSFTLTAKGAGAPGTISADVHVTLAESVYGGTQLAYEADAVVGGVIGGVGQRMLVGVTRKTATEFFKAIDADIAGASAGGGAGGGHAAAAAPPLAGAGVGTVYAGAAAPSAGGGTWGDPGFVRGLVTGGGLVLVGVLVGWAVGGR